MRSFIAAALLACPALALGQDAISYDYFHVGYTRMDVDVLGTDFDGDGPELEASIGIGKYLYLFGSFAAVEFDDLPDTDAQAKVLGIGAHFDLSERLSIYGGVGYLDGDVEVLGFSGSDDGKYLRAGVRFMPAKGFEIRGGIEHVDFDEIGDDTALVIGGGIYLTEVVTLDLNFRKYDDVSVASIGARFFFGNEPRRRRM